MGKAKRSDHGGKSTEKAHRAQLQPSRAPTPTHTEVEKARQMLNIPGGHPLQRQEMARNLSNTLGNQATLQLLQAKQDRLRQGVPLTPQQDADLLQRVDDATAVQLQLTQGRELDNSQRTQMESGLGTPLGEVQIHADATAARLANEQGARAFTVGQHVVFGAGEYRPGNLESDAILAHELAHVSQQRGATHTEASSQQDAGAERAANLGVVGVARQRFGSFRNALAGFAGLAGSRMHTGVRIARCVSSEPRTPEGQYDAVKDTLDKAEKGFRTASYAMSNNEAAEKAGQVADRLEKVNGLISKVEDGVKVYGMVQSFRKLSRYDPYKNPDEFAAAAGEALASAGSVLAASGIPGVSAYGEWLSNAGDFFTNMQRALDPAKRWGDREDWREAMRH